MKQTIIILLMLPYCCLAQQNFEGTIHYKVYSSGNKNSFNIETSYGKARLKTISWEVVNQKRVYTEPYWIYDFRSNLIYNIYDSKKIIVIDSLTPKNKNVVRPKPIPHKNKRIANFETEAFDVWHNIADSIENGKSIDTTKEFGLVVWLGKEIKYIIPDHNKKFNLISDDEGNILWLEMSIIIPFNSTDISNDIEIKRPPDTIKSHFIADNVKQGIVEEKVFAMPEGYKIKYEKIHNEIVTIKSVTLTEIEAEEPPPPPPPLPPPATIKPAPKKVKNQAPLMPD